LSLVNSRVTTAAAGLDGLLDLVGEALAVGGAVVDHRDLLAQAGGRELADAQALLHVVGDGAEGGLEALLGELGVGGGRRNLRDAAFVVDARGGDRGARVEVADHALDAASTKRWATVVAVLGSAASSSAITSNFTFLPPRVTPLAL
jgi:hypothetical protein